MSKKYIGGYMMKKLLSITIIVLLMLTIFTGCSKKDLPGDLPDQPDPQVEQPQFEEKEIVLFFPDMGNNYLLPEFRTVVLEKDISNEDMARIIIEELIKGTDNDQLKSIVPAGVRILDLLVADDTAVLDLSEEFIASDYNNKEKLLEIFAVVNTLSEIGIEEVNITIAGKPIDNYYTALEFEAPFVRNDDLMPSK
jgi:spore germination protein GerM